MAKTIISSITGICGAAIASVFGGWNSAMTTLLIFMAIDYTTGLICAGIFHKSPKSETGALESRAGLKGLCRKGMMLLIVLVACRIDMMLGTTYVKDAAAIALIANEAISIIENAGLMGVPMPRAVISAIDALTQKEEGEKK